LDVLKRINEYYERDIPMLLNSNFEHNLHGERAR